ncbi:uncharacterized protein LOC130205307 [Pseudoliparis swirei]|uniref:uncharacterized protein LOC130205307 n=1 Tax=Pseudoliparis swirei TaxID=2059687 RepID=UPI0024BDA7B4|nr:uncharacterized protein LOC130205307 [Pseudoliparis swirei]
MHAADRSERVAERRAEATTASAYTEDGLEGTAKTESDNSVPGENMGINHTKEEENVTSDESVVSSPPSLKVRERETAKTAETAQVNKEIKEKTSRREVLAQGGPRKEDSLPSTETPEQARFIKWTTGSGEVPVGKSFWGLRMREDVPEETSGPREETGARALTNGPETDGKVVQRDSEMNSVTDTRPKPALCRGLTHRTVAGRRRCAERAAAMGSKRSSTDALEYTGEWEEEEKEHIRCQKDSLLNHDQRDHFYYLDGVMRRVRSNLYPFYRRRR